MSNTLNKLSLKDLIAKKMQKDSNKMAYHDYFVKSLEGSIVVRKPDRETVLEAMDTLSKDESMSEIYKVNKDLIYSHVKLFQDKELQDAYECVEPDDIVDHLLELDEVMELGGKLIDWNGSIDNKAKEVKSEIKNS